MKGLIRRLVLTIAAVTVVGSSMGLALPALTQRVAAAGCAAPSIMFGRWRWCGYFYNRYQDPGLQVRLAGVPGSVNNVGAFWTLIWNDYNSGDPQKITGAVFVVRTMIGEPLPTPPCGLGTCKTLSAAQWFEFGTRLNGYASSSENGSQSFGPNGHIDWFHSDYMHCGDYNTYYQPAFRDIAPYIINGANTPECNNPGIQFDHIFFYDTSGNPIYRIRRPCMNPLGTLQALAPPAPEYDLTASITVTSGGTPLTSGSYVQAGDPVTFAFNVNNSMAGTATGIGCEAHANNSSGWRAIPAPETSGPNPPGVACTSTFGPGNTSLGSETIASAPNDTSLCRSLIIDPSSPSGGQSAVEVCVYVSSRPYLRVYGGDVSAGNPQSNACGTTTQAGIVGWSKDLTGYAGAATQYAALAIDNIYDFSTSLGNAAGAAAPPSGLAFANTTASGDDFGGNFGSLPCITNYYAMATTGTNFAGGSATGLNGTYTSAGPVTISSSTINSPNKVVLYVNGNVTITGNISYGGSFTPSTVPLFQVVASGSIFIDRAVTNLDGLYIAQANGAAGSGTIYTCTNGSTQYTVDATGSFNGPCNSKLTVNGAFIAKQVRFMRTTGTVKQASPGEASGTNQAEVFNFSPALWMAIPPSAPTQGKYDSITSLPPIL